MQKFTAIVWAIISTIIKTINGTDKRDVSPLFEAMEPRMLASTTPTVGPIHLDSQGQVVKSTSTPLPQEVLDTLDTIQINGTELVLSFGKNESNKIWLDTEQNVTSIFIDDKLFWKTAEFSRFKLNINGGDDELIITGSGVSIVTNATSGNKNIKVNSGSSLLYHSESGNTNIQDSTKVEASHSYHLRTGINTVEGNGIRVSAYAGNTKINLGPSNSFNNPNSLTVYKDATVIGSVAGFTGLYSEGNLEISLGVGDTHAHVAHGTVKVVSEKGSSKWLLYGEIQANFVLKEGFHSIIAAKEATGSIHAEYSAMTEFEKRLNLTGTWKLTGEVHVSEGR